MKTPLFLLVTVYIICSLSGCREKTCYYYNEQLCGEVKGEVKKVTDTLYSAVDDGLMYPQQIREYHFDSLRRLTEYHCSYFCTERDESGEVTGTSVAHKLATKYRYDIDGRRVESRTNAFIYHTDSVYTVNTFMRLAILEGNNEMWEIDITEGGHTRKERLYRQYSEGQYLEDYERGEERVRTLYLFDEKKRLIETRSVNDKSEYPWTTYKYDNDNQLVEMKDMPIPSSNEVYTTYYQPDEFDNKGNWLKRTELNGNKEIRYVVRRRIEYRI